MKTLAVLLLVGASLLGPLPGFRDLAAAQEPLGMIAYDYCQRYDWDQGIVCSVYLANGAYVGDGTDPAWSPDGSRIAFTGYTTPGIFVLNLGDWSVAQVSVNGGSPTWSPDGLRIAFDAGELYVMNVDGSNVVQITQNVGFRGQPAWSPDGRTIAFDCEIDPGNHDICAVRADGSGLVRLTPGAAWGSGAAFSPNGSTIAFDGAGPQFVVINADGAEITMVPFGSQLAWSPGGTRIAFVVAFEGACEADGRICPDTIYSSNVDRTDPGAVASGNRPAWGLSARPVAWLMSGGCNGLLCGFDGSVSWGGEGGIVSYAWDFGDGTTDVGSKVNHAYASSGTYTVTLTVVDTAGVTGTQTSSIYVSANVWPTASFTFACSGTHCTFDASASEDSDGSIASYDWFFGDGGGTSGSTASHTYTAAGTFTVTLIVTDNGGGTGRQQQAITIATVPNTPPVASFTSTCRQLACSFNARGSSDPDGTIASYAWVFGDGTTGAGVTPIRTYAAGGTYTVTLTVTDNRGATSTQAQSVTAAPPEMHVGDLDRARTSQQSTWTATVVISVHDSSHAPVANAVVSGSWNDGTSAWCTTGASGECGLSKSGIRKSTNSVSLTVTNVAQAPFVFKPVSNHDPEGDSNGTTISVHRQ